jgi:hypothetical protein
MNALNTMNAMNTMNDMNVMTYKKCYNFVIVILIWWGCSNLLTYLEKIIVSNYKIKSITIYIVFTILGILLLITNNYKKFTNLIEI